MKKTIILGFASFLFSMNVNAQSIVNNELTDLLQKSLTYFPKVKEVALSVQLAEDKLNHDMQFKSAYAKQGDY
jgi:hypothetical protein